MHLNTSIPITVVIPSIGGGALVGTLEALNAGDSRPREIIVSLPNQNSLPLEILKFSNVRVAYANLYGQVSQRCFGFRAATQPYVMQLDDDVLIDAYTIESMISYLGDLGRGHAIGLPYIDIKIDKPIYLNGRGALGFFQNFFYTMAYFSSWGVAKNGTVTKSTICFPVPHDINGKGLVSVDWLPGGCVIYKREDLILDNYYPLLGKAYCEDLLHSYLLKQKHISLWVADKLFCRIERPPTRNSLSALYYELNARLYLNRVRKISFLFVIPWLFIEVLKIFIHKVIHILSIK